MRRVNLKITLIILINIPLFAFSQIDSLKKESIKSNPDTQKIKIFEELSFYLSRTNPQQAEKYCDSAISLSKKINQKRFYGIAEFAKANLALSKSLYRNAINSYQKSNNLLLGIDELQVGDNYSDMGFCFHRLGATDSFFYYSIKAITIFEKNKREDKVGKTYGNMAYILVNLEKYDDAKKYFKLSNDICKKTNDKKTYSKNLQNQGVLYESLALYDSALYFYKESLLLKEKFNDSLAMSTSYAGIAAVYLQKKQFGLFLKNINISIDIAKKVENIAYQASGYFCIGEGYFTIDKIDSTIYFMNKAILLHKQNRDLSSLSDCYMYLAECNRIKGDFKNAFNYHTLYKTYYDSVFNESRSKQLEQIKIGYETEKKEKENQLLQTQNQLSTETIKQQKMVSYFVVTGLILALGLAFFIFRGLKFQRKANATITQQKHEVEEHRKEILDSIHYAKKIQDTLLAHKDFLDENLPNNFVLFKPKDIVSGDFYWATKHGSRFYLAVCDSTGHGVPGAFMSLLNIGFLSEAINEKNILEPHHIFNYVRERLTKSVSKEGQQDGFDGILLCIDQVTNHITYSAAHNAPVLVSGNVITELEKDKMPVGVGEIKEEFKLHSISVNKGDTLYLYTDGYADQFGGPKGKKLKYKPLNELLLTISEKPLPDQLNILDRNFEDWKGNLEQVDDVLIIGIVI